MDIANVNFFSNVTFYEIQKHGFIQLYIIIIIISRPRSRVKKAIHKVYCTHKDIRFSAYTEGNLDINLIGDGRCDSPGYHLSPGYNAKYGTYTLMDSDSGEILDVMHVGNGENSSGMEKRGFQNYSLIS